MMKTTTSVKVRHSALRGGMLAVCLVTSSCKLPPREAWNQIQQRGLFPVLFDGNPSGATSPQHLTASHSPRPGDNPAPLKVQAVQTAEIASSPFATPVPGRTGYVFSPHTTSRKLIDVRNYAGGVEVRCPYTLKPFVVPSFTAAVETPQAPRPQTSIAEVVSNRPDSTAGNLDPVPMLTPGTNPPPSFEPTLPDIPYGSRVPGRPGFVFSPYAEKNQLVDVAGIAPGVEVKCPYSDKLFRVPEPLPEEIVPAPSTVIPPAPPAPGTPATDPIAPPAPAPESIPPAPPAPETAPPAPVTPPGAAPAPAPATAPTAAWADKEKNQVQSPFGSPGQLIDVSGRPPGTHMQCPFTNKEFIIPAP